MSLLVSWLEPGDLLSFSWPEKMLANRRGVLCHLVSESHAQEHFDFPMNLQDMSANAKYIRAERALNAIATLSCKQLTMRGDEAMSRSASTKSILRLERFLSITGIDARIQLVSQSESYLIL